jgi:hypothetical protein
MPLQVLGQPAIAAHRAPHRVLGKLGNLKMWDRAATLRLNKAAAGAAIQFPRFLGFWEGDNLLSGLRIRELMPLGGLEL